MNKKPVTVQEVKVTRRWTKVLTKVFLVKTRKFSSLPKYFSWLVQHSLVTLIDPPKIITKIIIKIHNLNFVKIFKKSWKTIWNSNKTFKVKYPSTTPNIPFHRISFAITDAKSILARIQSHKNCIWIMKIIRKLHPWRTLHSNPVFCFVSFEISHKTWKLPKTEKHFCWEILAVLWKENLFYFRFKD